VLKESYALAAEIDSYLKRLFLINRSLTGDGNRETLRILSEIAPIQLKELPSGTKVYDWVIPDEWYIRDAWIKDEAGNKLIDWRKNNLHVVGYSAPVQAKMTFDELAPRLHFLEENKSAIPYRTSYYKKSWGFCVTAEQYSVIRESGGIFEIFIDSGFNSAGSMSIGEIEIPGLKEEEFLVSTYICHPSMANDNLSGMITAAFLAQSMLKKGTPEYSWRYIFVPETIGAIAYLRFNELLMKKLKGGFVVTTCGGQGPLGYKKTFSGSHLIDRAVELAFRDREIDPRIYEFAPDGSDERQYSSPGFRIPIATISKDKYYDYPQYHTSLDNLDFVNGSQMLESLMLYQDAISIVDANCSIKSKYPNGEVQLGSRGLYPTVGGAIGQNVGNADDGAKQEEQVELLSWVLFLADGTCDLVTIAEKTGYSFLSIKDCVATLASHELIEIIPAVELG